MKRAVRQITMMALAAANLAPLYWLIHAAFKSPRQGAGASLENFHALFAGGPYWRWMTNSLFVAAVQTLCVVSLSSLAGFALAKYRFAGQRVLMALLLAVMLLPSQVILGSLYELVGRLGWLNSYWAILVPGAVSVFGAFLFRQAMLSVPDDLLQSARLDGCGELGLWWRIALPLTRPMVGAFTLMSFLASWGAYLWPQIVLQDEGLYTLPLGLANLAGLPSGQNQYGVLAAGTLLGIVPVLALFLAVQEDFVAGLKSGAVKA